MSFNQITIRVILATVRTIVFVVGMVSGFFSAAVVSSYGGSATVDFSGVFFGLGLMLAAPICWTAAVFTKARDRWTLVYVVAWGVYFLVAILINVLEEGKPITAAKNAGTYAVLVLATLYLIVLPAGAIIYRRRRG